MLKKFLGVIALLSLLASLLMLAIPAFADDTPCTAAVSGVQQGQHTANVTGTGGNITSVLWPPNHKLRTISISASRVTDGNKEACDVTITDVRQTEAVDAPGSGNTSPDAANCDNRTATSKIDLRGERSGINDSRYYEVSITMTDSDNNTSTGSVVSLVPHDQGVKRTYSYTDGVAADPSYEGPTLTCQGGTVPPTWDE
jgi:hypothetical protein